MGNSKAYLSFVLLFAFVLSSHVLTHELPEGHKHSHSDEGNRFKYPTLSQDLEKDGRRGSIDIVGYNPSHRWQPPPPFIDPLSPRAKKNHYSHSVGSQTSSLEDIEVRIPSQNAKVYELEVSTSGSISYHPSQIPPPPAAIDPLPPRAKKGHNAKDHELEGSTSGLASYYPSQIPPPPAALDPLPPRAKMDHNAEVYELEGSTSGSVSYHPSQIPPPPAALDPLPPRAEKDHNVESHVFEGSTSGSVGYHPSQIPPPPAAIDPLPPSAKTDHYIHSIGYQLSRLEDIEPENYEEGSVMRHRKMMRPSEIDWKYFHAFPSETSSLTYGGKTGYNGVPRMEEVGEETMN